MTGEVWGSGHQVALLLLVAVFYAVARCACWVVGILLRVMNLHSSTFTEAESDPSEADHTEKKP